MICSHDEIDRWTLRCCFCGEQFRRVDVVTKDEYSVSDRGIDRVRAAITAAEPSSPLHGATITMFLHDSYTVTPRPGVDAEEFAAAFMGACEGK